MTNQHDPAQDTEQQTPASTTDLRQLPPNTLLVAVVDSQGRLCLTTAPLTTNDAEHEIRRLTEILRKGWQ